MFLKTKPEWMSEQQWRTARTILQNVLALMAVSIGTTLILVLQDYKLTHIFNWGMLWFEGAVTGMIAVITWLMNRK
jgi:hypothetical protein